jgi:hypothetical protein
MNNYKNNNGSSNITTEMTTGILYFSKCNSCHTSNEHSADALKFIVTFILCRKTFKQGNSYSCCQLMDELKSI